jgi:mannose-1-phosphate guanylyltransferase
MNALLLAAGFGTRLRPLTEHTPKCLVTIDGVSLMDIWLAGLSQAGFGRFLVNTHYLAGLVEAHLDAHPLRAHIQTVYETTLLGTGGTLVANQDFCRQGTTLVAHADNLCLCDWTEFIRAHKGRPEGTVMTMMTFRTATPESCGIVQLDTCGVVTHFFEKQPNPPGNLASAAVYLIEPGLFDLIESRCAGMTDISTELIPRMLGCIFTWHNQGLMMDIGTPESLETANVIVRQTHDLPGRVFPAPLHSQ